MTRRFDFEEEDGLFVCCNDIGDDSDEVNKKHAGRFSTNHDVILVEVSNPACESAACVMVY
jgi:hypothetical protein